VIMSAKTRLEYLVVLMRLTIMFTGKGEEKVDKAKREIEAKKKSA
jgi:hypothetical protein